MFQPRTWLTLGAALTLGACEEVLPPPEAGADAASQGPVDASGLDGARPTWDASAPRDAADEASTRDAHVDDAQASDDAATIDAATDAHVDGTTPAPACTEERCCMPFVSAHDAAVCAAEVCLSQRQVVTIGGSDGKINPCHYGELSYNGSDGRGAFRLTLPPQPLGTTCRPPTSEDVRGATLQSVTGSLTDSQTGVAVSIGDQRAELTSIEVVDGHLRFTAEGPATSATTVGGWGPDCPHGPILPVGLCNCRYEGSGPSVTYQADVSIEP